MTEASNEGTLLPDRDNTRWAQDELSPGHHFTWGYYDPRDGLWAGTFR